MSSTTEDYTNRCKYCGDIMVEKVLKDGSHVMQCPSCFYTKPFE